MTVILAFVQPVKSWLLERCPTPSTAPNVTLGRFRLTWQRVDEVGVPSDPGIFSELQLIMLGMLAMLLIERAARSLAAPKPPPANDDSHPAQHILQLRTELADSQARETQLAAQLSEAQQNIESLEADLRLHQTDKIARAAIHMMRKDLSRMGRSLRVWAKTVAEMKLEREQAEAAAAQAKLEEEKRLEAQKRKALDDLATQNMLLSSSLSKPSLTKELSFPRMV